MTMVDPKMAKFFLCFVTFLVGFSSAAIAADASKPITLVALGTSLTAGFGLPAEDGFTARLQKSLTDSGHSVVVENAGVSGDTSAGGLARLDWALSDATSAVIVELGSNDALRGLDPTQTEKNLRDILTTLSKRNLPVLLTGMRAPPNLGPEYAAEFEPVFHKLADEYETLFYPFFLDGVAAQPDLNQADGIHPNAAGVDVIVARILPVVVQLIDKTQADQNTP